MFEEANLNELRDQGPLSRAPDLHLRCRFRDLGYGFGEGCRIRESVISLNRHVIRTYVQNFEGFAIRLSEAMKLQR